MKNPNLLLLVAVGVGGYMLWKHYKKPKSNGSTSEGNSSFSGRTNCLCPQPDGSYNSVECYLRPGTTCDDCCGLSRKLTR